MIPKTSNKPQSRPKEIPCFTRLFMEMPTIENQLHIKELELKSLIDTIRLINTNASDEDLYRIYKFSLYAMPMISKMLLYVMEGDWEYKTGFETKHNYDGRKLPKALLEARHPDKVLEELEAFSEFDKVIHYRLQRGN